jgi:PAS domain S-box-containing protein
MIAMTEPHPERTSSAVGVLAAPQPSGHEPAGQPAAGGPTNTCLASLDPALNVVAANEDFCRQFGRSMADVCGRSLYDLVLPDTQAVLDRQFARLTDGRQARFAERMLGIRENDGMFAGELTGAGVHDEAARLSAIIVSVKPDARAVDNPALRRRSRILSKRCKTLLTPLDVRILEGVAAGASTVQLANRLFLSRQGVEYHVGSMLRKLRASNRAALVSRAYSMGLLTVGTWPPQMVADSGKL